MQFYRDIFEARKIKQTLLHVLIFEAQKVLKICKTCVEMGQIMHIHVLNSLVCLSLCGTCIARAFLSKTYTCLN